MVEPGPQGFGVVLRGHRIAAGLTQEELAARSGVSVRTIRNLERGRSAQPYQRSARWLAEALGLTDAQRAELSDLAYRRAESSGIAAVAAPCQLPAALPQFVGRDHELKALNEFLAQADSQAAGSGSVAISAISGMAGVGKTALAVHWARRAAAKFPDGQLYLNLRGFGPSPPMSQADALTGLLAGLGVRPDRVPPGLDAQVGLYRSAAAGKRLLIVLDNAADADQVRPLLPGTPGCLVVVTTRTSLCGLAVSDGAHQLWLDVLPDAEARQLLDSRIGGRAASEQDGASELIRLCAGLPLALAILAARADAQPGFALRDLAAQLADAGPLDALDAGDPATSIRTVISWSCQRLSEQAAQMFRLLGLHPGPGITVPAAASTAGMTLPAARRCLRELTDASLLTARLPGRFSFHDLIRAYAADQAMSAEDQQARHDAAQRILDHYLHTAFNAASLINPSRDPITTPPPHPGITPENLTGHQEALTWMAAEHQVLLAATTLADDSGFDMHAWQIPWAMANFLERQGHWQDMAAAEGTAVAAAARLGDTAGQATSLRLLALACARLGDHDQALASYTSALELHQQSGDRLGEAKVHQSLGAVAESQARYADALFHAEHALRLYQTLGNRAGQARLLNNVGYARALLGDYQQARMICKQALALSAELGLRHDEAHASASLGYAEQHLGNHAEAAACYQRALNTFQEFGNRYLEASVLIHIGDNHDIRGELQRAQRAWQHALHILDKLEHPDGHKLRAKLRRINAAEESKTCKRKVRVRPIL